MRYSLLWGVAAVVLFLGFDVWWDFTQLPSCLTTPPYARSVLCPGVVAAGTPVSNPLMRVTTDPAAYVRSRQNRDVIALFCIAMAGALSWFLRNLGAVEKGFEDRHDGRGSPVIRVTAATAMVLIAVLLVAFRVLHYRRLHFW